MLWIDEYEIEHGGIELYRAEKRDRLNRVYGVEYELCPSASLTFRTK